MDFKNIKHELQNILQGKGKVGNGELIQTTACYLRKSIEASAMVERKQPNKQEETKTLMEYINANNLWNCDINFNLFISEGAEQKVYIKDKNKVLKLN